MLLIARRVLIALALLFAVHVVRFYGSTIFDFIHADLVVTALLGAKCAAAKLPVVGDWYYVNGDAWFLAPHLIGALVVSIFGTSTIAVVVTNAIGFGLELAVLAWALYQISSSSKVAKVAAWLGAIVTLFPWSFIHLLFVWIELSYGWLVSFYVLFFALTSRLIEKADELRRPRRLAIAVGAFCFALVLQNPTRGLVFTILPLVVAIALQRKNVPVRRRLFVLGVVFAGWLCAFLVYRVVFLRVLTFSPHGGSNFALQRDFSGVLTNVRRIGSGIIALTQPRNDLSSGALSSALAILGLLVLIGAIAFTCVTAVSSSGNGGNARLRFTAITSLAQLGTVGLLLLFGNLVGDDKSIRYLLPGVLGSCAVGTVAAIETLQEKSGRRLLRGLAQAWLILLPFVGLVAISRRFGGPREVFSEGDPKQLEVVANELARRNLTHGFATPWNANTLTVLSSGRTRTCGVTFAGENGIVPQKWLVGVDCFDRTKLPPTIYFVAHSKKGEVDNLRKATAASLSPLNNRETPLEEEDRFTVADELEVVTFKTSKVSLEWLARPEK
jgi:hypothetical protein